MKQEEYPLWPILVVGESCLDTFETTELEALLEHLGDLGFTFEFTDKLSHMLTLCRNRRNFSGVLLNWYANHNVEEKVEAIAALREAFPRLPIIVITEQALAKDMPPSVLDHITMFYFQDQDTMPFAAGRIQVKIDHYLDSLYPPFFKALYDYVRDYKYAWHTPGHMGGEGFLKSPAGIAFYNFYGENVMRSDLSISVPELGSLLDHSGVVKESEALAEKTFNADLTYYILNGTSTANQTIWHSQVTQGDLALVDRNCHKSLNYAMVVTGACPMYMKPRRNHLGIIGPVPLAEFTKKEGLKKIADNALLKKSQKHAKTFKMSALTNSTYDGLCYNVSKIKEALDDHVENMHFDEAWYAYAAFHPIYDRFYGMEDTPAQGYHPPIFCSQSTHKLLTAFSQASMIHVKNGTKETIEPDMFNEAFMMHSSTSPNYQMIASLDVAAKMMHDDGPRMSEENMLSAIRLRKHVAELHEQYAKEGTWFFSLWQPERVRIDGAEVAFTEVDDAVLAHTQSAWVLRADDPWHGFPDMEDDYVMLDPIKLTFVTPGVNADGSYAEEGIPANIVTDYLLDRGIVAEKTDTYSFLMLHSFGTTEGKHGDLLTGLLAFKRDYDANRPLEEVMPQVLVSNPDLAGHGLRDFCQKMHEFFVKKDFMQVMQKAFDVLPKQAMTPAEAFEQVVRKNIEYVHLNDMKGRTPAVMLVPYPPGIPVMMGGEVLDEDASAIYDYLRILQKFENTFHGYEKDIHGVERDGIDGKIYYKTYCIKE